MHCLWIKLYFSFHFFLLKLTKPNMVGDRKVERHHKCAILFFPLTFLPANLNGLLHLHEVGVHWLGSNYNVWLWKSGFILCHLSLQVPWPSSHTEWMTAGLDCHWLAWSTSAGWVWCGCGRSRPLSKTNHLSTAERSQREELKNLQKRGHKGLLPTAQR